jgi:large subunit ribosomal protein L10
MSEKAVAEKRKVVDDLKERISRARVMIISDYLGFSVKEVTDLRKKLRAEDSELKVIKNTLIERAVAESGYEELKEHLKGSTAVLLGYRDAVAPLKVLVKFIRDSDKGKIRAGVVENKVFGQSDLNAIAKLPSKEVLIAKVIGGLQAPIYGLVNVLQGPIRKLVYALNAIKDKKG